jgi:hypothetical protein
MNRRVLLAGAASLLVVAGVLAGLVAYGIAAGGRDTFSTVKLVPAGADYYMAFNTDAASSQWIAVAELLDSVQVAGPLRNAWTELLAEEGIDWEEDIVAVLGNEAALAIADFATLEEGSGFVMVIELRDASRARDTFVGLIRSQVEEGGGELIETEYAGETVYLETGAFDVEPIEGALAFVDDVMVVTFTEADMEDAIDVIHGDAPNLGSDERFDAVRGERSSDFLVWGYADLAAAWSLIDELATTEGGLDDQTLDFLDEARANADALTFSMQAEQYGIVIDTTVLRAPGQPMPADQIVFEANFADRLSEDTVFFLGGAIDQQAIADYFADLRSNDPEFDQLMDDLAEQLGFQLDADLLNQLGGELGLAFDFSLAGAAPEFSVLGLAEVADDAAVQSSLDSLALFLEAEAGALVTPPDSDGVSRLFLEEAGGGAIGWGLVEGTLVIAYPDSEVAEFAAGASPSLADSASWQRLHALLPANQSYVMYLSLTRLMAEADAAADLDAQLREATDGEVSLADLAPIKALAAAGATDDRGSSVRVVLLIEE